MTSDIVFGGIVTQIVTNTYLLLAALEEFFVSQWANDTTNFLGFASTTDGPGNTTGIAGATTTSVAQDCLDYEYEQYETI